MDSNLTQFRIGPWQVDCRLGTLISDQSRQRLPPKLMSLLQQLALHDGELVSRERLLETVWEGTFVNDEVVSRAVAELRQALGDDAKRPVFIETIPKRGYRLIKTVETVEQNLKKSRSKISIGLLAGLLISVFIAIFAWLSTEEHSGFVIDELNVKSLTSDEGEEVDPAISDDGKMLVFAQLGASGYADLWLLDTESLVRRQLTRDSFLETNPVFSLDGTQIAYLQHREDGCSIVIHTIFNEESYRVAECRFGQYGLDWSPDGTELVYLDDSVQGGAIVRLNLSSGATTVVITNNIQGSTDQRPKYSADGKWINFLRGTNARRELYRIGVSGGQATALTNDGRFVSDHAWVGDNVVFSSDRLGLRRLWFLDIRSGSIDALGMTGAYSLSSSRDGTKLAFESAHYAANIYRVQLDLPDLEPVKVVSSNAYDNYPSLSPDGNTLAHNSNRSGVDRIWMANPNGEHPQMIYQQVDGRMVDSSWSADGSRLLATRYLREKGQILEYSLESKQTRVIDNAGTDVYGPRYAGQWIYYIERDSESPILLRILANGLGKPEQLGVTANRVLTTGNGQIYYTKPAQDGIYSLNPDTREESMVVPDLQAERWKDWALEYPWLAHIRRDAHGANVVVISNLDDNTQQVASDFSPNTVGGSIDISSDGKTLFVARTDRADLDIKMIDLPDR